MSLTYTYTFTDYYENDTVIPYLVEPKLQPCAQEPLEPTSSLILCVLLIVIFLLAIPGNLLVGWVISTSKQALTPSDVYLFHLTVADGLMALTLPFFAVSMVRGWIFGDFLCKLLNLIIDANSYTSIVFLACISIDRYLVIVHAKEALRTRQRMWSRVLCVAVWVIGWALALPALFHDAMKLSNESELIICSEVFDIGSAAAWRLATRGFCHIFGFAVPLIFMMTCYSIIIARLLHTRGFQKYRAMRVIIAVVVAFLLCWTPYHITLAVDTLLRAKLIPYDCAARKSVAVALLTTNSLGLLHSCINPFLYAFVGQKFRKKMLLLFQRRFKQERMSGSKFSRSTSHTSEGSGTGTVL